MLKYLAHLILIVVMVGLACPHGNSSAQDSTGESLFKPYSTTNPVIERGSIDSWHNLWNEPGGVIYHNDTFYFFRNGANSRPTRKGIGLLSSDDGVNWQVENNHEPILQSSDVEIARLSMSMSSVLVLEDGTWISYFYTQDRQNFPMGGGDISFATADNPTGPWQPHDAPILARGAEGEWDEAQVSYPNVHRTEDGFVMYYAGFMPDQTIAIGMATSPDGITWEKYDDPATTEAPYADSDPIIVGVDGEDATMPHVLETPDGWVMIYKNATTRDKILLATSADGINWTTQDVQPLAEDDFGVNAVIGFMSFMYHEGTYYLYVEVAVQRGYTEIYLTTYDGSLSFTD